MPSLAQGQVNDRTTPALVFFAADDQGMLADLEQLEFQIFRSTDEASRLAPVQVFPVTPGEREPVDLAENGADRLGKGRYVAPYTVPEDEPPGLHEIRWFWRFEDKPEQRVRKRFDVVNGGTGEIGMGPAYALVSDMRAEGVPSVGGGSASDARIQSAIVLASQYVEAVTGRRFGPFYERQQVSGRGTRALLLGEPIVAIERIGLDTSPDYRGDLDVDPSLYRVFNRHLRGMLRPDDRDAPKLEFVHTEDLLGRSGYVASAAYGLSSLLWTTGVQNCDILGVFGFTDPDGSPWGEIPALIRHATKLLVMREMCLFWDVACRETWRRRWRLTSERTRDQSYTLAAPASYGGLIGDPEIDMALVKFLRPPAYGAA